MAEHDARLYAIKTGLDRIESLIRLMPSTSLPAPMPRTARYLHSEDHMTLGSAVEQLREQLQLLESEMADEPDDEPPTSQEPPVYT